MDAFEALQDMTIAITVTAIAVVLILYTAWAPHNTEEAVPFTVPVPEQCLPDWKGEVLENPSLKVSSLPSKLKASSKLIIWPISRSRAPPLSNAMHPQRENPLGSSILPRKTASIAQ